jgi:hypothetical protein
MIMVHHTTVAPAAETAAAAPGPCIVPVWSAITAAHVCMLQYSAYLVGPLCCVAFCLLSALQMLLLLLVLLLELCMLC